MEDLCFVDRLSTAQNVAKFTFLSLSWQSTITLYNFLKGVRGWCWANSFLNRHFIVPEGGAHGSFPMYATNLQQYDHDAICAHNEVRLSRGITDTKQYMSVEQFLGIGYGNESIDMKQ